MYPARAFFYFTLLSNKITQLLDIADLDNSNNLCLWNMRIPQDNETEKAEIGVADGQPERKMKGLETTSRR